MSVLKSDVGALVGVRWSNEPDELAAGAANGAAVDRHALGLPLSVVLAVRVGDIEGAPSAQTIDAKIQDSADGSTGWADITGAAITQITAANTAAFKDVDLTSARRHVRTVVTVGFTGGASPNAAVAAALVFGPGNALPVS
jgi:hypothetical protein